MVFKNVNIEKFEKYLQNNGLEVLPVTNEYENIRFKGTETGVLYLSGKTSGYYADLIINCFKKKVPVPVKYGRPVPTGRQANYKKEKRYLLKRDGDKCFYCDKKLGNDITIEHIIPLVASGKNSLGNMVLAHEKCNHEAGNLSVYQKLNIALEYRTQNIKEDYKKLVDRSRKQKEHIKKLAGKIKLLNSIIHTKDNLLTQNKYKIEQMLNEIVNSRNQIKQ